MTINLFMELQNWYGTTSKRPLPASQINDTFYQTTDSENLIVRASDYTKKRMMVTVYQFAGPIVYDLNYAKIRDSTLFLTSSRKEIEARLEHKNVDQHFEIIESKKTCT